MYSVFITLLYIKPAFCLKRVKKWNYIKSAFFLFSFFLFPQIQSVCCSRLTAYAFSACHSGWNLTEGFNADKHQRCGLAVMELGLAIGKRGWRCSIEMFFMCWKHTNAQNTPVFNGGKSCITLRQPKNLVKQIRPRPAEQFNYAVWL